MSDMLIGKANLNNFNIGMKDFMQEYNNSINDIQEGKQGLKLGEVPKLDPENINITEDQELANDLKVLLKKGEGLSGTEETSTGLSSDDTVKGFGKVLNNYINEVNSAQNTADKTAEIFAAGGNIDVHSVMIAQEKANLSMQLTMQMRNKILQAYQEISRMNV